MNKHIVVQSHNRILYCSEIENYSSMHRHRCSWLCFPKMDTMIYGTPRACLTFWHANDMNIRSFVIVQLPGVLFFFFFPCRVSLCCSTISIVLFSSSQILSSVPLHPAVSTSTEFLILVIAFFSSYFHLVLYIFYFLAETYPFFIISRVFIIAYLNISWWLL